MRKEIEVLEGKAKAAQWVKSMAVSYVGNLVGSLALAAMAVHGGLFATNPAAVNLAVAKTSLAFLPARAPRPRPRGPRAPDASRSAA